MPNLKLLVGPDLFPQNFSEKFLIYCSSLILQPRNCKSIWIKEAFKCFFLSIKLFVLERTKLQKRSFNNALKIVLQGKKPPRSHAFAIIPRLQAFVHPGHRSFESSQLQLFAVICNDLQLFAENFLSLSLSSTFWWLKVEHLVVVHLSRKTLFIWWLH